MDARDETVINVLLKISRITGFIPPNEQSRWFYTRQILTITFNLFYSCFCIYQSIISINHFSHQNTTDITISILSSFSVVAQGLSFQIVSLWIPKAWNNLHENLTVDYIDISNGKRNAFLEVVIMHLIFLARLAGIVWIWYPVGGIYGLWNNSFRLINDYCFFISVLLMIHVNIIIKKKSLLMNSFLLRPNCLRRVYATYGKIKKLIDYFNIAFGYQILFILAYSTTVVLQSLQDCLWFNNGNLTQILWEFIYVLTVIVIM